MKHRRILGGAATMAVGLGLAVTIAPPASAHHEVIVIDGACNTATGLIDGTVVIESDADYGKDWFITALTATATRGQKVEAVTLDGIPVGASGTRDDQSDFVGTFAGVAPGSTMDVSATARWHRKGDPTKDVVTATRSGSATFTADCAPPPPPPVVPPQPPTPPTLVPPPPAPRHAKTHVRVVDRCSCYRDSVTMTGGDHVRIKASHLAPTVWVFKVTADDGYLLPSRIGGHSGWAPEQTYRVTTTNTVCPCKKRGDCAQLYPGFTPPSVPCRGKGC